MDAPLLDQALAKAGLIRQTAPPLVPAIPEPKPLVPLFDLTREAIEAATVAGRDAVIADLEKWKMLHLPFERLVIRFPQEPVADAMGVVHLPELARVHYNIVMGGEPLTLETIYTTNRKDAILGPFTAEQMAEFIAAGTTQTRTIVVPQYVQSSVLVEDGRGVAFVKDINETDKAHPGTANDIRAVACEALTILLASLAVRNVVKDVRYNGRTSRAEGDRPVFISNGVTYLSHTVVRPPPADEMENDPDHPPREQSKPHLRRGHDRRVVADTTGLQPEGTRVEVVGTGRTGRRWQWIAPTYVNVDKGYVAPPHYVVRP
jgi:hypothetical protein